MQRRFDAPQVNAAAGESVSAMIAQSAKRHSDRTALICDELRLSWRDFDARVNRVANALLGLGLTKGDKVAVLGRNSPEYVEIFIGTLRAGCCVVPLSTMAPADALERMITDSGAKIFLLADELRDLAASFLSRLDGLVPGGRIAIDFSSPGWQDYRAWRDDAAASDPGIAIGLDDDFNIIYSSGTTGVPKGIMHSNGIRTHLVNGFYEFGFAEEAVTVLSTPLYSNTTIVTLLPTLAWGGTTVLMRKFDVAGFLGLVQAEQATHTMLVPVQYHRIMAHPDFDDYDLSSMRVKLSTSAPLRAALKRDIVDRFPGLMVEIYGLTEGGGATMLSATEHPDKLESVGQPAEGTELKIIGEDGREVPPGTVGEIVGRSPNMMMGYYGRPDLTDETLWHDPDGRVFFRSGDMGRFDEDGFLFLSDRKKDMIISGGLNIFADDLERVLLGHPEIDDAAVVAIPSPEWGETPLGLVVATPGTAPDPEAVRSWANQRLGKAQRLSAVEFRDSLPRSSIGKILKRELRAPYWRVA